MSEVTPSENEWLVMEVIWEAEGTITATEIIARLTGKLDVAPKTIRVMINRLLAKGIISYQVDKSDARIYHYYAVKKREACLAEKRNKFVKNYFGGNSSMAVASFLSAEDISDEQLEELEELVKNLKGKKS